MSVDLAKPLDPERQLQDATSNVIRFVNYIHHRITSTDLHYVSTIAPLRSQEEYEKIVGTLRTIYVDNVYDVYTFFYDYGMKHGFNTDPLVDSLWETSRYTNLFTSLDLQKRDMDRWKSQNFVRKKVFLDFDSILSPTKIKVLKKI